MSGRRRVSNSRRLRGHKAIGRWEALSHTVLLAGLAAACGSQRTTPPNAPAPQAAEAQTAEAQTTEAHGTPPRTAQAEPNPDLTSAQRDDHTLTESSAPKPEPSAPAVSQMPPRSSSPSATAGSRLAKVGEIELEAVDPSQLYEGDAYIVGVRGGGSAFGDSAPSPLPRPQVSQQTAAAHVSVAPLPDPHAVSELIAARGRPRRALVFDFCIDREGRPRDVVRQNRRERDPWQALYADAIARWRFAPFEAQGRPVPVCTTWTFDLRAKASR